MKNRKTNTRKPSKAKLPEFVIDLAVAAEHHDHGQCSSNSLFGRPAFFLGGGDENYNFRSNEDVRAACLAEASSDAFTLPNVPFTLKGHQIDASVLSQLDPMAFPIPKTMHFIPATTVPVANLSTERQLGQDLSNLMVERMFRLPVYTFFARDIRTLTIEKPLLAREYWEIADSLLAQLKPAQEQVLQVLPQVMTDLATRFPKASIGQLYQGSLQLIGRQLAPILSTIQMWTSGFRQSLDPDLQEDLAIARAIVEQGLWLTLAGNLKLNEMDTGDVKQMVPTINVSVGDVVLPVLVGAFDSGPAVIPMASGALGPRGGHLCFLPDNLRPYIGGIGPVYVHEEGHVDQGIIGNPPKSPKYMPTKAKLTATTIAAANITFDEPVIMIGEQKVPAKDFWTMVFIGHLPEVDADNWGMLTAGPAAFGKCFINYVGGMKATAAGGMDKVDHVLRSSSSYKPVQLKDGRVAIKIEPHPHDIVRIGSTQASTADEMGYPEDAAYLRAYAKAESGKPAPTHITWEGEQPEPEGDDDNIAAASRSRKQPKASPDSTGRKPRSTKRAPKGDTTPTKGAPKQPELPTITASVADYDKVARVLAKAYLHSKDPSLNGMSQMELVCLTPKMHAEKVVPLVELLKKGVGSIPKDGRHHFLNHVGAACILALYELVDGGMDATKAREIVMPAAKSMMLELLKQWEADKKRLDVYNLTEKDVQPTK